MILSVVIICINDVVGIEKTLKSVSGMGADILVYDFGSTDGSQQVALNNNARLKEGECESIDRMRFKAVQLAKQDWILILHSGEVIDDELKRSISQLDLTNQNHVFRIPFKNYFGCRWLRYGELGRYSRIRLANRLGVKTPCDNINEKIFLQAGLKVKNIRGHIIHHAVKDTKAFAKKITEDALVSAVHYQRKGKKARTINLFISPLFSFVRNYFFKLGFLDGWEGYFYAKMGAWYTFLKYTRLRELNEKTKSSV